MNEDEPSSKKRRVDENDEFSENSEDNREDGEIADSDEEESSPLNISTPCKAPESSKPPIKLPMKCPVPHSGALRLPVFLPLPQTMSSTPKPRSCPVVLPFLPHMMKSGAPPIPLPKVPRVSEKETEKALEECYSKTYSDENSEASDQEMEASDVETETTSFDRPDSQISSIQTVDSVDIPTGVNSEPSTGELQRTVIENPEFKKSAEESQSKNPENDENDEPKKDELENLEYEYYTKSIVRHKNGTWVDSKDPIPDGWTVINHHSGFPLYLHKESRVATWARPYYIGTSNAKSHKGAGF